MGKDVLYTDWSLEGPDPIECEGCGAVTSDGEECACDDEIVVDRFGFGEVL